MARSKKKAYAKYLTSKTWKLLRDNRLALDKCECVLCGSYATNVHHRRYPDKLGTESINDLVSLCYFCHNTYHKCIEPKTDQEKWYRRDVNDDEKELLKKESMKLLKEIQSSLS